MLQDYGPNKPVSFSNDELREILAIITQSYYKSKRRVIFVDREKCDAIFLFIENVLKSIRRHNIKESIIYETKCIVLIKSGDDLEFEVTFKQKEMKRIVFEKLRNNTKMHICIKNKKEGSVLSMMPEKRAIKK